MGVMRYRVYSTEDEYEAERDALWIPWHAERSLSLSVSHPERGHTPGGPLGWQSPRPASGNDPGRPGGLVWDPWCVPAMREDDCITLPSGRRVVCVADGRYCAQALAGNHGRAIPLPAQSEIDAHASLRPVAGGPLANAVTAVDRQAPRNLGRGDPRLRARKVLRRARRIVEERRARLLLGHTIGQARLNAPTRSWSVDRDLAVPRHDVRVVSAELDEYLAEREEAARVSG